MKLGIIISTNEPETVWNALRLCVTALKNKHKTKIFLLGKGVELEEIRDKKFNVKEQMDLFIKNQGQILACGTCLESRGKQGSSVCPISTMNDLLRLVKESDKVLTFG